MKVLAISLIISLIAFAIAVLIILHRGNVIDTQREQISGLTANVNLLIDGRKKDYADKVELAKRNEELEQEAEKDTSCFGWNTDISHSAIVQRLRQN
jgi:6-phosphogluconate dehydrogenase